MASVGRAIACGGPRGCGFGGGSGGGGSGSGRDRGVREEVRKINGAPEWEEDAKALECRGCSVKFSLIVRKHHCRHCGAIFCVQCCREKRPLPKFDYLKPVRVCRNCAQMCWKAESLLLAIRANNIDLVRRYVKGGKDCNFYSGVFPPLTIAATGTSPEMVALLIQGKADVGHQVPACWWFEDQLYKTDHVGVTALHAAVQVAGKSEGGKAGSQWQIIKTLLEGNADVNARTRKGNTPLLFACNAGLPDCAALLIQHGAAVHSHNIGASLVSGIVSPVSDIGVSLTGAAVNAQNSADGDTPLHRAVREAHVDCVRLLLTHGAHTHLLNACDLTPQTLADRLRQRAVIDLLSAHASSASQTPAARTSHRTPQPCMSAAGAPPPPHWPTDSKDSGNHSSTGAGVAACTSAFTPGSRVAT